MCRDSNNAILGCPRAPYCISHFVLVCNPTIDPWKEYKPYQASKKQSNYTRNSRSCTKTSYERSTTVRYTKPNHWPNTQGTHEVGYSQERGWRESNIPVEAKTNTMIGSEAGAIRPNQNPVWGSISWYPSSISDWSLKASTRNTWAQEGQRILPSYSRGAAKFSPHDGHVIFNFWPTFSIWTVDNLTHHRVPQGLS